MKDNFWVGYLEWSGVSDTGDVGNMDLVREGLAGVDGGREGV